MRPMTEGIRSILAKVGLMMQRAPIKAAMTPAPWTGVIFSFRTK